MEVCCALTAVCKLINKDMMPALLPQVLELVGSKRLVLFCFVFVFFNLTVKLHVVLHQSRMNS